MYGETKDATGLTAAEDDCPAVLRGRIPCGSNKAVRHFLRQSLRIFMLFGYDIKRLPPLRLVSPQPCRTACTAYRRFYRLSKKTAGAY